MWSSETTTTSMVSYGVMYDDSNRPDEQILREMKL